MNAVLLQTRGMRVRVGAVALVVAEETRAPGQ
jgi:hypothetical protein